MITFYTYPGPNGRKVAIMLEEIAANYDVKIVDINKGEQFEPSFLKISPNNKIPAIIEHGALGGVQSVFETGAILVYLGERSGRFLATSGPKRAQALQWLFWSLTGIGGTLPQVHYFGDRKDETPPAILDRFCTEAVRLFRVLERRLGEAPYLAEEYSIADMPAYASVVGMLPHVRTLTGTALGDTPNIDRWLNAIGQRSAVQRGMAVPKV